MRKILGKLHDLLMYSIRQVLLSQDSGKICLTLSLVLTNNYSKTTKKSQCRQNLVYVANPFMCTVK